MPEVAELVCRDTSVDVMLDLESAGKQARQGHLSTWKSSHTIAELDLIRRSVPAGRLIVRVDPWNQNPRRQIEEALVGGADWIMLPMFRELAELQQFIELLNGRAEPLPLVETPEALAGMPSWMEQLSLKRFHVGLNDLHLAQKQDFLFQPIAEGQLEHIAQSAHNHNIGIGIGGTARANEGIIKPEALLGEHVRLGSSAVILSQTFHRNASTSEEFIHGFDFFDELKKLEKIVEKFEQSDTDLLEENRISFRHQVRDVVTLINRKKRG